MKAAKYPIGFFVSNGNLFLEEGYDEKRYLMKIPCKKNYHNGTGNSNESGPELVMKYVPKLTMNFGSIINCNAIFTNTMKTV